MNEIRLLTFDLDDTLWSIAPVIGRAERRLHRWLLDNCPEAGHRYNPAALRALRLEVETLHPELADDISELRRASIRLALQRCKGPVERTDEAFDVFWQARNEVELYPDVIPALQQLREHYTLAAISNGNACIRLTGLAGYFSFSLSAREVGVMKPGKEIFLKACAHAGVAPEQTLHVGDDIECDIDGALGAGIHAAWINRRNETPEPPLHDEVLQLSDLLALTDRLLPPARTKAS